MPHHSQRAKRQVTATALSSGAVHLIVQYLAASLRQQRVPDAQKAIAESVSALAEAQGAAATAAEELQRMRHDMVTAAVPIALFTFTQPQEFRSLIEGWRDGIEVSELARNGCVEALGPR